MRRQRATVQEILFLLPVDHLPQIILQNGDYLANSTIKISPPSIAWRECHFRPSCSDMES